MGAFTWTFFLETESLLTECSELAADSEKAIFSFDASEIVLYDVLDCASL